MVIELSGARLIMAVGPSVVQFIIMVIGLSGEQFIVEIGLSGVQFIIMVVGLSGVQLIIVKELSGVQFMMVIGLSGVQTPKTKGFSYFSPTGPTYFQQVLFYAVLRCKD